MASLQGMVYQKIIEAVGRVQFFYFKESTEAPKKSIYEAIYQDIMDDDQVTLSKFFVELICAIQHVRLDFFKETGKETVTDGEFFTYIEKQLGLTLPQVSNELLWRFIKDRIKAVSDELLDEQEPLDCEKE